MFHPLIAKHLAAIRAQHAGEPHLSFDDYYRKRYKEEVQKLCSAKTISFSMCLMMPNFPDYVERTARAEYSKRAHKRAEASNQSTCV